LVVLNAINLPDSVANLYFKPPSPDLQTLLYTTVKPQCSKLPASWFALRTNCKLPNPDN